LKKESELSWLVFPIAIRVPKLVEFRNFVFIAMLNRVKTNV